MVKIAVVELNNEIEFSTYISILYCIKNQQLSNIGNLNLHHEVSPRITKITIHLFAIICSGVFPTIKTKMAVDLSPYSLIVAITIPYFVNLRFNDVLLRIQNF